MATDGTKTLAQTTVVKYYYVNGQLHFQETVTQKPGEAKTTDEHYFYYDSNGYLTAIGHKGGIYYAATNQRGDVVALYYADGRIMGRYEYDAWGNIIKIEDISYDSGDQIIKDVTNNTTSTDLVVVNPIRYRGYYYDSETKLYYLQSRYYNAAVGRFLNSDNVTDENAGVLGYNTFLYCANNPVNSSDPSGHGLLKKIGKHIWQNIKTTFKLFVLPIRYVKASVGLGVGLGGSASIKASGNVIGGTCKYSSTTYLDYSADGIKNYSKTGTEVGVSFLDVYEKNSFCGESHMLDDEECTCEYGKLLDRGNCPANKVCYDVSENYGVSGALYLGFGGEFSIGFDFNSIVKDGKKIWSEYYESDERIKLF